jgi:hypothetical protein
MMIFTLIGDVVGSRRASDRDLLQRSLSRSLRELNRALNPSVPFEPTVGDEFQACFDNAAAAVGASLMARLELLRSSGVDSRFGLGVGEVEVFSKGRPRSQDGPGWWAARDAIESIADLSADPHTAFARTAFAASEGAPPEWQGEAAALNAYLLCRDAMVDAMKQPSRNRLYGLMRGWPQTRIAEEERATQGAISQSLARSGAFVIAASQRRLEARHG